MAGVCIIGTGFGGIAAAIALLEAGHEIQLLERAASIGGTWRDSVYPGCACDVRSHLYSLSTELNPDWSRRFSPQAEIRAYLERVVDKHELRPRIRFGSHVLSQEWLGDRWLIRCRDGFTTEARFVVNAIGALRDLRMPELPGLTSFEGPAMHSGAWDRDVQIQGKRVGVIGTGASAIQVVPAIVDDAAEVHVFQRTPAWVVPRQDRPYSESTRWALRVIPGLMSLVRLGIYLHHEIRYPLAFGHLGPASRLFRWALQRHIRRSVADPQLAERLTPAYQPGCKRILSSDDWYPALNRSHVHLHEAVDEVVAKGVRAGEDEVELDVLVFCTGYRVDDPLGPMDVRGVGGRSLRQFWGRRPRAHLGITTPGFPNSFGLLGPNTALGHSSVVIMIEAQVRYLVQAIAHAGDAVLDVRAEALQAFLDEVDAKHRDQVWMSGCRSWYLNEDGDNFTIWPGSTLAYLWRTQRFDASDFA